MKAVFNDLKRAKVFFTKGDRVKKSRWWSVWEALEVFFAILVLLHVGSGVDLPPSWHDLVDR